MLVFIITSVFRSYHPNPKELLQKLSISVNKQVKDTSPEEFQNITSECYKIRDLQNEEFMT